MIELENIQNQIESINPTYEQRDTFLDCYKSMTQKLIESYNEESFSEGAMINIAFFFEDFSKNIFQPLKRWTEINSKILNSEKLKNKLNSDIEKLQLFEKESATLLNENKHLIEQKNEILARHDDLKVKLSELEELKEKQNFLTEEIKNKKNNNEKLDEEIQKASMTLESLEKEKASLIDAYKNHFEANLSLLKVIGSPEKLDDSFKEIETKLNGFDDVLKKLIKEREAKPLDKRISD